MDGDAKPIDPKLFELTSAVVREGLAFIDRLVKANRSIKAYENWPTVTLSEGMPDFSFLGIDPPVDYKDAFNPFWSVFGMSDSDRQFDFEKQKAYQELKGHVRSESFPAHVFPADLPNGLLHSALKIFLENAIDRFIHITGHTSFDSDRFLDIYLPLEAGLLLEELPIEIYIPILRVTAASDLYDIENGISILRMPEQIQLARTYRDHNTHDVSEYLLHQASHALVLRDHTLPNLEYRQHFWGYSVSSDSTDLIDTFFGCLRIITAFESGYAQVLFIPLGWAHSYQGNLPPMLGLTIRKYPPTLHPVNAFYGDTFPKLSDPQIEAVRDLFRTVLRVKSSSGGSRFGLATKRLNSCYMREDQEDAILDATIGLEILLSDGEAQEVTHKLGLRLAALSTLVPGYEEQATQIFRDVKKSIYPYRSAVVHGNEKRASKIGQAKAGGANTAVRQAIQYLGMAVRAIAAPTVPQSCRN